MCRTLLLALSIIVAGPAITALWHKESGWISTCAAVGCHGMRSVCYEYRLSGVSRYCYRGADE